MASENKATADALSGTSCNVGRNLIGGGIKNQLIVPYLTKSKITKNLKPTMDNSSKPVFILLKPKNTLYSYKRFLPKH